MEMRSFTSQGTDIEGVPWKIIIQESAAAPNFTLWNILMIGSEKQIHLGAITTNALVEFVLRLINRRDNYYPYPFKFGNMLAFKNNEITFDKKNYDKMVTDLCQIPLLSIVGAL